jgi:hypothetical protein
MWAGSALTIAFSIGQPPASGTRASGCPKRGIDEQAVKAAFALTRKDGYEFPDRSPGQGDDLRIVVNHLNVNPNGDGPSMGPVINEEIRKNWVAATEILETKFKVAETQNPHDQEQELARAFAELLNEVIRLRLEKVEGEVLENAPVLTKVVEKTGETYYVSPDKIPGGDDDGDDE